MTRLTLLCCVAAVACIVIVGRLYDGLSWAGVAMVSGAAVVVWDRRRG